MDNEPKAMKEAPQLMRLIKENTETLHAIRKQQSELWEYLSRLGMSPEYEPIKEDKEEVDKYPENYLTTLQCNNNGYTDILKGLQKINKQISEIL